MAITNLPTRTNSDANAAADINTLNANDQSLLASIDANFIRTIYGDNAYGSTLATDFNAITKSGFYTGYGTATGAPDSNFSWFVLHQNSAVGSVSEYQRATAFSTQLIVMERTKIASTWGSWTPRNMGRDILTVTITSADVTLTANQCLATTIVLSGVLTGNYNLIFPTDARAYKIINNCTGAYYVTVKTASGTGVVVNPGETLGVYCDGTNIVRTADKAAGLSEVNDPTKTAKVKKLTGTTASTQGATATVAHGLDGTKIIGMTCIVNHASGQGMLPNQFFNTGYQYDVNFSASIININNHATNSANILSKPFIVTIFYEA